MTPALALACWERALEAELGIIIALADERDIRKVQNLLYEVRKESGNPDLEKIIMCLPGDAKNEIFLCKKAVEL